MDFQILFISVLTFMTPSGNKAEDSMAAQTQPKQENALAGMDRGVWVAEIQGWKVIAGTICRLGPPGTLYQPMINRLEPG